MEEAVEIQAKTLEVLNDQGKQMNAIRNDFDKVRYLHERKACPCCQPDVTSIALPWPLPPNAALTGPPSHLYSRNV
jgi:hypothetical protein